MRLDADDTPSSLCTHVPDPDGPVCRSRGKDGRFCRTPLKILDAGGVAEVRVGGRGEAGGCEGGQVDFAVDIARQQAGSSPLDGKTFCAAVVGDGVHWQLLTGARGTGEGVDIRADVKDMDLAGLGKGGDVVRVGHGAAYGSRGRTHTVDRTDVRDGQKVQGGIFVVRLVVVVVFPVVGIIVVVVLGLGQVAEAHDDDLVLGLALAGDFAGLRAGDDPRGVRVRRAVGAEAIAQDVERQAGPRIGERMEGEVDRVVGHELLVFGDGCAGEVRLGGRGSGLGVFLGGRKVVCGVSVRWGADGARLAICFAVRIVLDDLLFALDLVFPSVLKLAHLVVGGGLPRRRLACGGRLGHGKVCCVCCSFSHPAVVVVAGDDARNILRCNFLCYVSGVCVLFSPVFPFHTPLQYPLPLPPDARAPPPRCGPPPRHAAPRVRLLRHPRADLPPPPRLHRRAELPPRRAPPPPPPPPRPHARPAHQLPHEARQEDRGAEHRPPRPRPPARRHTQPPPAPPPPLRPPRLPLRQDPLHAQVRKDHPHPARAQREAAHPPGDRLDPEGCGKGTEGRRPPGPADRAGGARRARGTE